MIWASFPVMTGSFPVANKNLVLGYTPSPRSDKIIFNASGEGVYDIYVIDDDGSNLTNLTNNSAFDKSPSWSPDGTKIVFTAYRNGSSGISIINSDGTDETRLFSGDAGEPRWEP